MPLTLLLASKVTFIFDGLFFFCFKDPDTEREKWGECQVGVLPHAPNHPLGIVIKDSVWDEKFLDITVPCHKVSRLFDKLFIEKSDRGGEDRRVTRHNEPIDRMNRLNHEKSFNWVIDFENHELHGKTLVKRSSTFRPVLRFKEGHFYTYKVSKCLQRLKRIDSIGGASRDFGYVAMLIGVDIELNPGSRLLLKFGDLILQLAGNSEDPAYPPPSTYTITLSNTYVTPESDEDEHETTASHQSDLRFFYDHFLSDPNGARFDFIPKEPNCREDNKVIPPYVCYGVTGSRTDRISED